MFNILVCDDDKEIVDAIDIYLSQEGYHILKAYDGLQAIEIMKKEEVHLILLDIMMPNLDGIRATRKIRETSSVPIIMLSAKSEDVDKILAKYPDIDGIMTTSAVTALGLSEAVEGIGISIVSVDAQEDALKAVQDGQIVALGAQSGYTIGYETIRYIVKDLQGEGTGEDEILDSQVLTAENIDAYIKEDKYSSS